MKKTLFLPIILSLFLSGCISVPSLPSLSSLNLFSDSKEEGKKKEIEIPKNAPAWVYGEKLQNHIVAVGVTKDLKKEELHFHKQKALINAGHSLTKKIYVKTVNIYKAYLEKTKEQKVFEKDIKKFAEHISLKSLTKSKIKNNWISSDNNLFIQVGVDSDFVAQQIQNTSKLLFEVDKNLYHSFLSNRAKKDIIKLLEE